jgi:hypothetical protein
LLLGEQIRRYRPLVPKEYAAAILSSDIRALTPQQEQESVDHQAQMRGRSPDRFAPFRLRLVSTLTGKAVCDGPEHAVADDKTLCGIPRHEVEVMRHVFNSRAPYACGECAAAL